MEGWYHCFPKTPNVIAIRKKIMLQDLSTIEYAFLSEQMATPFLWKHFLMFPFPFESCA